MDVSGQHYAPIALPPETALLPIVQENWVDFGACLDGFGKSSPAGVRTTNRTSRNESLYRLT
jgi:hypothetical protein